MGRTLDTIKVGKRKEIEQNQERRISWIIARETKTKERDVNEFNTREILLKREHRYEVQKKNF